MAAVAGIRLLRHLSAVPEEGFGLFISGKDKLDAELVKSHLTCRSESGHHGRSLNHLVSDPKVRTDHEVGARVSNVDRDVFHVGFGSLQKLLQTLVLT